MNENREILIDDLFEKLDCRFNLREKTRVRKRLKARGKEVPASLGGIEASVEEGLGDNRVNRKF
jgi:hypothetical protein